MSAWVIHTYTHVLRHAFLLAYKGFGRWVNMETLPRRKTLPESLIVGTTDGVAVLPGQALVKYKTGSWDLRSRRTQKTDGITLFVVGLRIVVMMALFPDAVVRYTIQPDWGAFLSWQV